MAPTPEMARAIQAQRTGRLRQASRQRVGTSQKKLRTAPIGGWNTRDSLENMPQKDAVVLDNWFPDVGKLTSRLGIDGHATGVGSSNVESLMYYNGGGGDELIAAGGGALYDATSAGAATSLASGFSSDRWDGIQFKEQLHMVNANSADNPQMYNGSTITEPAWSGSGLSIGDLVGVSAHKERLYFWEAGSQDFWYAAVQAITGTLTKFPLSMVATKGGYLIAIETWTIDGGSGPDDYFVAFMSTGETIIYQGNDPGDSTAWGLVGRFQLPKPLGRRGFVNDSGDILVMTEQDYISMTKTFRRVGDAFKANINLSKLSGAASTAAKSYGSNFGWQAVRYPAGTRILFNVPVSTNVEYVQHGINTVTGAPFRFTGINARCWCLCGSDLYLGYSGGRVLKANTGFTDDGTNITVTAQTAWDNMGIPDDKAWKNIRPIMTIPGTLSLQISFGIDFTDLSISQTVSYSAGQGTAWDAGAWDTFAWANEEQHHLEWLSAAGDGSAISVEFQADLTTFQLDWHRVDYSFTRLFGL